MASVKTTCPYCGVGCGVRATPAADGSVGIEGDPEHPSNFGRLCSKGSALGDTVGLEGRLLHPLVGGRRATWDAALDRVAGGFAKAIAEHGPDSVAFYVSGQLLTEDYYVVNKLAKGFVGTANIDTNSRLCMASSVAGHRRAFGSDTVPGSYEDLEQADLLVLVGSNAAWCHPILFQRMVAAKAANPSRRIVVIDPRRTDSCESADLHLQLRPGSDAVLFNGLLSHLARTRRADGPFIMAHTSGADTALAAAAEMAPSTAEVAAICGLSEGTVHLFYDWFAKTERVVSLYSQGINQSASGTDKVNAILNCHLYTGRIGRPGMGPFSLTGQPNAMGGREVGGLANQLAAHMEIENAGHRDLVQGFWQSPTMATKSGLKAVDMFDAIADRRIRAVWIMSTNPVVSLPNADKARLALEGCDLVVVSDCMRDTDTGRLAHVLLPAAAWGEKDGTVTNSERRISRQRPFRAAPGEAKPDWWMVCEVARRLGHGAKFDYRTAGDVFREHAALSGHHNAGSRDFDISGLAGLDDAAYDALTPVQWPVLPGQPAGTRRLFAEGGFFTPDRRARFVPVTPRAPDNATRAEYPMALNTGRVRDHWHTMTRTGLSARLSVHSFEPLADLHPEDAKRANIVEDDLVRVASAWGDMLARARLTPQQRRGCVFVPMHWNGEYASRGRVNVAVNPAVDPVSGQPELKHTPVRVERFEASWYAVCLTRGPIATEFADYAVHGRGEGHWRHELAGTGQRDWNAWARSVLAPDAAEQAGVEPDWIVYSDPGAGSFRIAAVAGGRLQGCLFVGRTPKLPPRAWLASLMTEPALSPEQRLSLLAGRPLQPGADIGPIVCSCFSVGLNRILDDIRTRGTASVEALGVRLKAGTNCGSCKPELARILRQAVEAA